MSLFEYLGVLISVIMGLGITHVLVGVSKTIHLRDSVKIYWVHLAWAVNVLIYVIAIWWGMFWWSRLDNWSFFQFLFVIVYAVVLFLLASLLFPWDFEENLDFEALFYRNRRWFFGTLALGWCIDLPETVMKGGSDLRAVPEGYLLFVVVLITLSVIGATTGSRWYHRFFVVFWPVWLLGYLALTTLSEIATQG